jgi:hypothetical protein
MFMKFASTAFAGALLATSVNAAPVVFDIDFDGAVYDGGGTLTIDDSLIAPNAFVALDNIGIDITFGGVHFVVGFNGAAEGFTFDALGLDIISTTFVGNFTEFLDDPNWTSVISLGNGAVPGAFQTSGLPNGDDRGTYTITRGAPSTVPLPAGAALLVPALGALAAIGRRRKAKKAA